MDFNNYRISDKTAVGKVIYIDDFGNIITNINGTDIRHFLEFNESIMVFIGDKQLKLPFIHTYGAVKPGSLLATIGSSNYLEISMNIGDAAKKLKVKYDDDVKILFG